MDKMDKMDKMDFIPAIDMIDGKCVRLTMGDYDQKTYYHDDPVEVAKSFEAFGVKRLHLVDLDGAKSKKVVNLKQLERIANATELVIDFGGGIQSHEDIADVFDAGAQMITAGSIAVNDESMVLAWIAKYGTDRIILGADTKDGKIAVSGWSEKATWEVFDFIAHYVKNGIRQVISTDVSKDGMMQGPSFGLYKKMMAAFPDLQLIASGGVSKMEDVLALQKIGVSGVIVGKAYYEGTISLNDIGKFVKS